MFAKIFKLLLPPWRPWRFGQGGFFEKLVNGLAVEYGRLKAFMSAILIELSPDTAINMLPEWYKQYAIDYDPTQTLTERQQIVNARHTSIGGQNYDYLRKQLDKAGFTDIEITGIENTIVTGNDDQIVTGNGDRLISFSTGDVAAENIDVVTGNGNQIVTGNDDQIVVKTSYPASFYFVVSGEVDNIERAWQLRKLIEYIFPFYLEPVWQIYIRSNLVIGNGNNLVTGNNDNLMIETLAFN